MSIELNVRTTATKTENAQLDQPFVVGADKSDFTVSTTISYAFSKQIKGGVSGRWQDTNDAKLNRKSHMRELQIWAEIRF